MVRKYDFGPPCSPKISTKWQTWKNKENAHVFVFSSLRIWLIFVVFGGPRWAPKFDLFDVFGFKCALERAPDAIFWLFKKGCHHRRLFRLILIDFMQLWGLVEVTLTYPLLYYGALRAFQHKMLFECQESHILIQFWVPSWPPKPVMLTPIRILDQLQADTGSIFWRVQKSNQKWHRKSDQATPPKRNFASHGRQKWAWVGS